MGDEERDTQTFDYPEESEYTFKKDQDMAYKAAKRMRMDQAARSAAASRGTSVAAKGAAPEEEYAVFNAQIKSNAQIQILAKRETQALIEYYKQKKKLEMEKGDTTKLEENLANLEIARKAWMDAKKLTEEAARRINHNRGASEGSATMTGTGGNPRGRKSRGRKSRGRKSRGRKSRGRKSRGRKSRGRR